MIKMTPLLFSRDKNLERGGGFLLFRIEKIVPSNFLGKIERGSCNSSEPVPDQWKVIRVSVTRA